MTLDEISLLSLNKQGAFIDVLYRLLDFASVPEHEATFTFDPDDELSFYDRLEVHTSLVKPTLQEMTDELVIYKAELTATENARLAEVARQEDLNDRWNSISDLAAFDSLHNDIPNSQLYFKEMISAENDHDLAESRLVALEVEDARQKTENDKVKYIFDRENEYIKQGASTDKLIIALWEQVIEGRPGMANAIEAKRQAIKTQHPKPS